MPPCVRRRCFPDLRAVRLANLESTITIADYLLMSTRSDWLHSTLTPSTIAASGPYPHGYFGTTFWDQVSSLSWSARPAIGESAPSRLLRGRTHSRPRR